MQDVYQDFECEHCHRVTLATTNDQIKHASDCPSLIAYSEILKDDPEAVMEEDLIPSGNPYTIVDGDRIEVRR
jgi:hypothetical protein